jgi:tetratricopeptide (TPR) repeat protein
MWRRHWRLLAVLGLVFVAYSNAFQGSLVFDSASVIGDDPRIREATPPNIGSILTGRYWYVSTTARLYRPLTTLSYLLNFAILDDGPRPAGYHWVNLALHEVNVALTYGLGLLVFGETAPALALAAIWGLHPLLTESVTNIVGRADLLAAFGVLAGLLCHMRGASSRGRCTMWLAGLAAAQAVGLFSKESAAVLPGAMLLCDLTWFNRSTWRWKARAYAVVALPFAVFFYLRSGLPGHMLIDPAENPLVGAGFWTARLTALEVVGKYIMLFVWPAHLSADYSYNAVSLFGWRASSWEDAKALIALAVCLGAAILAVLLAVRWRRPGKPLLFFLAFFFVALSPVSNIVILIGSIMAERFLYLPAVGLAGCVVAAIHALVQRRSKKGASVVRVVQIASGLVCLALAARTYGRNFDWQDERSLWTSAVKVCPDSARPHFNLGNALSGIPGRLPEAMTEYQAALRIRPDDADAHNNLGNALSRTPGRLSEAIAEFQAALRTRPEDVDALDNLGNALTGIPGRLPEAIAEYQAALLIRPDRSDLHYNLASALLRVPGRLPEAIVEYQAALRIRPDDADAHNNLGNALSGMPGRLSEAIAEYQAALRIRPDDADAHYNLGNALADIPVRLPEAIAEYQAALRIRPDYADAHNNLANALAGIPGRLPEAIAEYEAAMRIRPNPQVRQLVDRLRAGWHQPANPRR